jgi:DNA polymerase (family 10)
MQSRKLVKSVVKMQKKISYDKSLLIIQKLKKIKKLKKIIPVGSIRRKEKKNKDIDLLLVVNSLKNTDLSTTGAVNGCKNTNTLTLVEGYTKNARHQKYLYMCDKKKYLIDIFICLKKELPYMLFHYTGNKKYNIRTRFNAKRKGWLLNQYGLWDRKTKKQLWGRKIKTEKDLTKILGISYKKPEDRIK